MVNPAHSFRRREAAELARVLLLSTQEAFVISDVSPHTLTSSSKGPTQDSKEMELRLMQAGAVGPTAGTIRPSEVMGPPDDVGSFSSGSKGTSGSGSGYAASTSANHSTIQSFTPSHSHSHPISSSNANSKDMTIPRSAPHPQSHIMIPPSSIPHFPTQPHLGPPTTPSMALSSPIPPGPISRLSSTKKSSEVSSHRPVFSPTQGSRIGPTPMPDTYGLPPRVQSMYGGSGRSASPDKSGNNISPRRNFQLSSSPPSDVEVRQRSPKKQARQGIIEPSSDNEIEEPLEVRPIDTLKSNMVVVLPSRSKPPSSSRHSPDPLDSLSGFGSGSRDTPARTPAPTSASLAKTPATASSSRTPGPPSTTASSLRVSQQSADMNDSGSRRVSKRVQDATEKKEAEKEERRRKRREEKERKLEEERRKATREASGSSAKRTKIIEERPTREERRSRRHETEALSPQKEPDRMEQPAAEPAAAVVEVMQDFDASDGRPPSKDLLQARTAEVEDVVRPTDRGRKRKVILDDEEEGGEKAAAGQPEAVSAVSVAADDTLPGAEASASSRQAEARAPPAKKAEPPAKTKAKNTKAKAVAVVADVEDKDEEEELTGDEDVEKVTGTEKPVQAESSPPSKPASLHEGHQTPAPMPTSVPRPLSRSPLKASSSNIQVPSHRPSPGPVKPNGVPAVPGGIQWRTSRNDLTSVLSKFPGSRTTGMSKRLRIAPLHAKIGPPAKTLPPVPQKPVRKKKGEESEEEDEEEGENGNGSGSEDEEEGKKRNKKAKAMEWLMMED